jgi:hypothetical protein
MKRRPPNQLEQLDLSPAKQKRLAEAQSVFRTLGSKMRSFEDSERMTVKILQGFGYDPAKARAGLIGLSNRIDTYGGDRYYFKKMIQKALRLPES